MKESWRLTLWLLVSLSVYLASGKFTCTAPNTFGCDDCGTLVMCQGTTAAPTSTRLKCSSGQACTNTSAVVAGCTKPAIGNPCKCEKNPTYLPDPFDKTHYVMCATATAQYYLVCEAGKVFDLIKKTCIIPPPEPTTTTLPPITCTEFGFFTDDPTCKSYFACLPDETDPTKFVSSRYQCEVDLFFDERTSECVTAGALQPSEFDCPDEGAGGFLDTAECNKFHICSGGIPYGDAICCEDGARFSQASMNCVPESEVPDSECPQISKCLGPDAFNATCPATRMY